MQINKKYLLRNILKYKFWLIVLLNMVMIPFIEKYIDMKWFYFLFIAIVEFVIMFFLSKYLAQKMYKQVCNDVEIVGLNIEVTSESIQTSVAPPFYYGYQVKMKFENQILFLKMISFSDIKDNWGKKYPELEGFCYKNKIKFSYIDELLGDIHMLNKFDIFK